MRLGHLKAISVVPVLVTVIFSTDAAAQAVYQSLGTTAPPGLVGFYAMSPFDTTPQAAIADGTTVTTIPGSPIPGSLTLSTGLDKHTVPGGGWSTWSHGYTGPVFGTYSPLTTATLTLPPNTGAFYLYIEPDTFAVFNITATTDTGVSSGPVPVNGSGGATGFGFYTLGTTTITSITITAPAGANGFAIGEFGIASKSGASQIPTLSEGGILALLMLLAASGVWALARRSPTPLG